VFEARCWANMLWHSPFVTYPAIRLHLLMRAKPLFEQSIFVFAGLVVYEFLLWVIDGWSGHPTTGPHAGTTRLAGGLIWP